MGQVEGQVWRVRMAWSPPVFVCLEPVFIGSTVALAVNVPQLFVKNPCFAGAKRRIFFSIYKKFSRKSNNFAL
jgi:hypothetical protein